MNPNWPKRLPALTLERRRTWGELMYLCHEQHLIWFALIERSHRRPRSAVQQTRQLHARASSAWRSVPDLSAKSFEPHVATAATSALLSSIPP